MNDGDIASLRDRVLAARRIVFFTGAGMSAESGIPIFRDSLTGLWTHFDRGALSTRRGFREDPALVWGWYEDLRIKIMHASPNAGHTAIAEFILAHPAKLVKVVTQNIDDLHERAGCEYVTHLHGSIFAPRCFACARPANAALLPTFADELEVGSRLQPPRCDHCNGRIRPGVVWFGEALPQEEFKRARTAAREAKVFIVIGTSGVVEPAASLVRIAKEAGAFVISIDPNKTMTTRYADAVMGDTAGNALPGLLHCSGER